MDWDDLRIIAAIRDSGTFAGAGMRLGIDETTISRRLARLQKTLGDDPVRSHRWRAAADGALRVDPRPRSGNRPACGRDRRTRKRGAWRWRTHSHCHHQFAGRGNSGTEVGGVAGPQSRSDAAVPDLRTERQFCALGGGSGRAAAQAGEGQFHDHEARGRSGSICSSRADDQRRRGAGHLRLSR